MNFKVGQRVRLLETEMEPWTDEGVIVGIDPVPLVNGNGLSCQWVVRADRHSSIYQRQPFAGCWWCHESMLRPLTDPGAESFLARVKGWGPLHEEPKRQTVGELVDEVNRLLSR